LFLPFFAAGVAKTGLLQYILEPTPYVIAEMGSVLILNCPVSKIYIPSHQPPNEPQTPTTTAKSSAPSSYQMSRSSSSQKRVLVPFSDVKDRDSWRPTRRRSKRSTHGVPEDMHIEWVFKDKKIWKEESGGGQDFARVKVLQTGELQIKEVGNSKVFFESGSSG